MSGHLGGATNKWSQNLYDINRQLRSGKTIKGKDLTLEKKEELEQKKAAILEKMTAEKEARHHERMRAINDHTTEVGNEIVKQVGDKMDEKLASINALLVTPGNGNIDEQIAAKQHQVKLLQTQITSARD